MQKNADSGCSGGASYKARSEEQHRRKGKGTGTRVSRFSKASLAGLHPQRADHLTIGKKKLGEAKGKNKSDERKNVKETQKV